MVIEGCGRGSRVAYQTVLAYHIVDKESGAWLYQHRREHAGIVRNFFFFTH